jgi:hypothetical protein
MNTSALKTFAPAVRTQLMEAVTRKLDFALTAQTPDYLTTFAPQVAALRKLAQADRAGLIERVAYTWFNRLAALRFMDARGWHPFRARVLTPASAAEMQPELLKLTRTGALPEELKSHTDPTRLNDLLDGRIPSPDAQGEVYRHLVLAACRFYHALLPNLFEKLDDETELLLPDDLLTEHSVVHGFRTEISDEDCGDGQRANVEILGWLYQFYISERKDQVMARKSAVPTEDIPAVTQLFTPHWIVRYLVENSLGRLWLLNRPGSRLREHMPYYIEGENNAPGGSPDDFLKITKPQEIRLCDPAVGSGHMLTYAFDLLTLIYEEEGYAPTEIPALILRHNLHGLEICPRAAQLAELALVFKAREKSRRFFQPEHLVRPRITELRDVRFAEGELSDYFKALGSQPSALNPQLTRLLYQFEEAKNFGSLIQPCLTESEIVSVRSKLSTLDPQLSTGDLIVAQTHLKVLRVLEQAEALTQRYHVVVANPPFMGNKSFSSALKELANQSYVEFKTDLYSMFTARILELTISNGSIGMMTPFTWMFLSSYLPLRRFILDRHYLVSLVKPSYTAFFQSAIVPICAFVINKRNALHAAGSFFDLGYLGAAEEQSPRFLAAINGSSPERKFSASASDFKKVPSSPIAYWFPKHLYELFETGCTLGAILDVSEGIKTGNNDTYLRFWHEVAVGASALGCSNQTLNQKWVGYHKGGDYRRWYGNYDFVINWKDDGAEIKASPTSGLQGKENYFAEGFTWSKISSSYFGVRLLPSGVLFDSGSPAGFAPNDISIRILLSFLSSRVTSFILKAFNPTLNFQVGNISNLPWIGERTADAKFAVEKVCDDACRLAKQDWDSFETSWDFRDQPLLRPKLKGTTLEASWLNWEAQRAADIRRMQELETENNQLWINVYGLQAEVSSKVLEDEVTLARANNRKDMAAFLSYAVGCMMGRYGLDHPGLILANAGDTLHEFLEKVGKPLAELTFAPDEDGIIPVLDGEWFEDDIVARTRDFLRATFGEATLRENLRFLEDSLGKDLRKYFLNDFYKDHLQTYKKRPIYWLVQSPRKGFSVLLYLHRYTRDTMNLVLNRYLRDYQVKLRNRLAQVTQEQATATTAKAKTEARKEADKLTKSLHECEEWERQTLLPLAQQRIELDLDDGVKTNYLKLGEALAPIAGLAAKEEET